MAPADLSFLKDLSFLGGAISSLIAAIGYYLKTRHERKRATRTALFYLLELHRIPSRLAAATEAIELELPRRLHNELRRRGVHIEEEALRSELRLGIPVFQTFGRTAAESTARKVAEGLTKALEDLAKEDPVLAFRLYGREQLLLLPSVVLEHIQRHDLSPIESRPGTTALPMTIGTTLDRFAVQEIAAAIKATAWRCSLWTYWRAVRQVRAAELDVRDLTDLDAMIQAIADDLASSQKAAIGTNNTGTAGRDQSRSVPNPPKS